MLPESQNRQVRPEPITHDYDGDDDGGAMNAGKAKETVDRCHYTKGPGSGDGHGHGMRGPARRNP